MIVWLQVLIKLAVIINFLSISLHCRQCLASDYQVLLSLHPDIDSLVVDMVQQSQKFRFSAIYQGLDLNVSKLIFDPMLSALAENSSRKYFISQMIGFEPWYEQLSEQKKQRVKDLLQKGQLEIANGGWIQNDESITYVDDILDLFTKGHSYLYVNFSYRVRTVWKQGSYGHSHSQSALFHLLGIEFQGIEKVDQRYTHQRMKGQLLEFVWSPYSHSNNQTYGSLLTHIHISHEQLSDQTNINIGNEMERFYHYNIFWQYLSTSFPQQESLNFEVIGQKIDEWNRGSQKSDDCLIYKYGNPLDYSRLLNKDMYPEKFPKYQDDFLPYWHRDRYWNGFYTINPHLKKDSKDFSRLLDFYKKMILLQSVASDAKTFKLLRDSEKLLAFLQHRTGMPGTASIVRQQQMMTQIQMKSQMILDDIKKVYGCEHNQKSICEFYKNQNTCRFHSSWISKGSELIQLSIISHGSPKKEKIQIVELGLNIFLEVQEYDYDLFCQQEPGEQCRLVFEAALFPGINQLRLKIRKKQQIQQNIHVMSNIHPSKSIMEHNQQFSIGIDQENQIVYEYGENQFVKVSFYISENKGKARLTKQWDKFGVKHENVQHVAPGKSVMFNNGRLQPLQHVYSELRIAQGNIFYKVIFKSNIIKLELTIKKQEPHTINTIYTFKPPNRKTYDYFMKASSHVRASSFYHDSNGYLVIRRTLNERPDYNIDVKQEDTINANLYPVSTFAYMVQNNSKFILFSDRAQGVGLSNESFLINFDRLTNGDGEGSIGQGYLKAETNVFQYKFSIVSKNDDNERMWQKSNDIANIGIVGPNIYSPYYSNKDLRLPKRQSLNMDYLKYSIYHLNIHEIVLRLFNLGEFEPIQLLKYQLNAQGGVFQIQSLGLTLSFIDICESYANGIPMKDRQSKKQNHKNIINISVQNRQHVDDQSLIILRPLEIRSFRINFKQKFAKKIIVASSQTQRIKMIGDKRKGRCF